MAAHDWDHEVEQLGAEIELLRRSAAGGRGDSLAQLGEKRLSIAEKQASLSSALERTVQLAQRQEFLTLQEKSLVWWATQYAGKLHAWYSARSKLLTRMLWIKLIRTRLSGVDDADDFGFETEQLIDLATRHTELEKTEKHLRDAWKDVKGRQSALMLRYNMTGVAWSNKVASLSLQGRLGVDVPDALQSPAVLALVELLTERVDASPVADDEWLARVRGEFSEEAGSLINACKNLVLAKFGIRKAERPEKLEQRLRSAARKLERVSALERSVGGPGAFDHSKSEEIPAKPVVQAAQTAPKGRKRRPILVQNPSVQVKNSL